MLFSSPPIHRSQSIRAYGLRSKGRSSLLFVGCQMRYHPCGFAMGLVMSDMWAMHAIILCRSLCCMSVFIRSLPSAPGTSPFAYSTCSLSSPGAMCGVGHGLTVFFFSFLYFAGLFSWGFAGLTLGGTPWMRVCGQWEVVFSLSLSL